MHFFDRWPLSQTWAYFLVNVQEHLDYDNVAKQAPIVTEEVSKRLEDIIIQRIKDKAWDDVLRKYKPIENPYEYKKKLILDQVTVSVQGAIFFKNGCFSILPTF